MTKIREDFFVAFVVAGIVTMLVNLAGGKIIDKMEIQQEEGVYGANVIGGVVDDTIPVVSSIDEMMQEKTFTFCVENSNDYLSDDRFREDSKVFKVLTIPSGEKVLVTYHLKSTQYLGEDEYGWNRAYQILYPVGKVVKKQLSDELLAELSEEGYTLTDTSFYVDMTGKTESFIRKKAETYLTYICTAVAITVFLLLRYMFILSGLYPPVIPLRFLRKWKRWVSYYGIIYYGDVVKKIHELQKRGKKEEAAKLFSELASVSLEEARSVIANWKCMSAEGILMDAR